MSAIYQTAYVFPGNQFGFIQDQIQRLTEYAELEGSHKGHCIKLLVLCRSPQESHHEPQIIVQMLLDLHQAWCCDHCPGKTDSAKSPSGLGIFPTSSQNFT